MKVLLFFLALITALILEGIGVRNGREIAFWIVIILPIAAYFLSKKGEIPKKIAVAYLIFLIISGASTAFSQNVLLSLRFLALYTACGFAFLYTINHKQILARVLVPMILFLSVFFCIYSIFIINFVPQRSFLMTNVGYQWVFPLYNAHNHIGDFLLLPLIICLYYLLKGGISKALTIRYFLLTVLFLPFFLFAYTRSAYVSLVICAAFMIYSFLKQKLSVKPLSIILISVSTLLCAVFFAALMFGRFETGLFSSFYNNLLTNHELSDNRLLFGARDRYAQHAINSTINNPIVGVGPGNYIVASKKYIEKTWQWTDTSHNIFIDVLSENGIPALIVFLYVFYIIFKRTDRSLYFFLALLLFLDFQTDYTYRMYSILILFVIFLGLSYKHEDKSKITQESELTI